MKLLLNPYAWLIVAATLATSIGGGYWWGHSAATNSCAAKAGKTAAKTERIEDDRDEAIAGIGSAWRGHVDAATLDTRGTADERAERIRTIVVPGDCRDVPAPILRELDEGRERINAKLRGHLRPGAPGSGAAPTRD